MLFVRSSQMRISARFSRAQIFRAEWLRRTIVTSALTRELTRCTSVHTIETDDCEWDAGKARDNLQKHGVRFSEAAVALLDPFAVTRQDPDANGEARYISLGMSPRARILVTVFSFRGDKARIISARKASLTERRLYRQR